MSLTQVRHDVSHDESGRNKDGAGPAGRKRGFDVD